MESTYLCVVCGEEFKPVRLAQKFCSKKCRNKSSGEDRRFSGVRDYVISRDKYQCQKCGTKEGLVVHHKDWVRTNNIPDNLLTLCRSCHKKEHFELVNLGVIKQCLICGCDFHPMISKCQNQILCRRKKCATKYKAIQKRSVHEQVDCIICGQLFTQKHSLQVCCSKECTKVNNKRLKSKRYTENRGMLIERQKELYEANKEGRLAYIKKWQAENAEKVKEHKRLSAAKNRERRNDREREKRRLKKQR